ncbi:MAG: YidC/Oxa1 family membrane protein insertase [Bacillota bacterium]
MDIIYNSLAYLLSNIFQITGDWGIAIIIMTVIVRGFLLPISIKQKLALEKQQEITKKVQEIKSKFKNEKEKMEAEISKLSQEGTKNMLGCLVSLLQLPILYSLYTVFMRIPMDTASIIVPWLTSLKLPDPYFIIPALTVFVQLMPNALVTFGFLKTAYIPKVSFGQVIITSLIAVLFFAKAPVALGVYWVTSGFLTSIEQILYSIYKRKSIPQTT